MSNKILLGIGIALMSNLIAAISQILLKKAAVKTYSTWWRSYVNVPVIAAYTLFIGTTVLSVAALRYIPLSLNSSISASGQIFVPVLSYLILREKISRKRLQGMALIILGIVVFAL